MIFVDTSFFFALFAANDPDHKRVLEVFASFKGRPLPQLLLTTNHIVFETIRLARRTSGHEAAVFAGTRLYDEKLARIHWATPEEERAAFAYLTKYQDKHYSPVDCLSFVVMKKLGHHRGPHPRFGLHPSFRRPSWTEVGPSRSPWRRERERIVLIVARRHSRKPGLASPRPTL